MLTQVGSYLVDLSQIESVSPSRVISYPTDYLRFANSPDDVVYDVRMRSGDMLTFCEAASGRYDTMPRSGLVGLLRDGGLCE
jgi:hypothetical protein